MTVKAPQVGAAEEQAEVEDGEWGLEEEGWAAPDRAPAQEGIVCAHNAALLRPIKLEYPVTKCSAPSVARPWSENSKTHMTA